MTNNDVFIDITLQAPLQKVWQAISDKEAMQKWYFDLPEFIPAIGYTFSFNGGPSEQEQYRHLCEVTESIPEQELAYSWRYDGYEGVSHIRFQLSAVNEATRLRFSHTGLDSFPKTEPNLAAKNFKIGWDAIITTSLKEFVEG